MCALGFGIGLGFKRVPPALVEAARASGFPVFAVPYETPFREIIHFVDSSLTSGEEQVFRRLTALQRYLVDALRTPQPERAMVDRLAQFLDASVLLLSAEGEPEIVAGKPPVAELLKAVCGEPPGLLELEVAGWHAVAMPIVARADQPTRSLVLASPRRGFIDKLAKPAAEATAPLLAAMAQLSDVVRDQEQAVKAALLEEALEPAEARDLLPLAARAAAFGLDFSTPRSARRRRGRRSTSRACAASWSPSSITATSRTSPIARADSLAVLVQGRTTRSRPRWRPPATRCRTWRSGSGGPSTRSPTRTTRCATPSSPSTPRSAITRFEDFDLATFMVSEIAPDRLDPKVDEILSVLRANPALHEALSAYFAHDLDIAATAASLHMHRNSLRYRLARAEQVLGRSLKQPATIAAIHIALVAEAGVHAG